ncbi:MAG: ABC transporter permease [Candidatus Woesearchaeota archaeon]
MIADFFILSLKGIRSRKLRSWLTMLGIFIGIAAVVSLVSLGEGLKSAITSQFSNVGTDKLVVQASGVAYGPPGTLVVNPLTERDANAIRGVPGVKIVAERLIRTARITFEGTTRYAAATSIPEDESRSLVLEVLNLEMHSGRILEKTDKFKIVVGNDFGTKKLFRRELRPGDKVEINGKIVEIIGVLDRISVVGGNQLVLMNDNPMRELLGVGDAIDIIAVQVQPNADIEQVADTVKRRLRRSRDVEIGKEDFSVQTPTQALQALSQILAAAQWFLVGIAFISIVVGAVGITNTMYTAVLERRREIGIMKSVGARNSHILLLFLVESGIIGMVGGLIGILLGVGLSQLIVWAITVQLGPGVIDSSFSPVLIFGALLFSYIMGSVAGAIPAFQASRLNPVDALRK